MLLPRLFEGHQKFSHSEITTQTQETILISLRGLQ